MNVSDKGLAGLVSVTTVARAFKDRPDTNPETKKKSSSLQEKSAKKHSEIDTEWELMRGAGARKCSVRGALHADIITP